MPGGRSQIADVRLIADCVVEPGSRSRAFVLAVTLTMMAATPARSQESRHVSGGFGGAFVIDQAPRLVLGGIQEGESSRAIVIDGGAFVAPRFAIGFELMHPPTITTSTSGLFGTFTQSERELTLAGDLRVTVVRAPRWTLDLIAGIGRLRGSIDSVSVPRDPRSVTTTRSEQRTLLIVPIGVDVPIETVRHLAFGPMIRVHWLRGDRPVGSFPGQTFGLLDQSTTRVVVGAVVRAFW